MTNKATLYMFYDFKAQQSETIQGDEKIRIHKPNFCVVQQVCSSCLDDLDITRRCELCGVREFIFETDPVKEIVELAMARRQNIGQVVLIAHNAQSYDLQFI